MLCTQLDGRLGLTDAAFNLISISEPSWRLGVMVSPEDGLTLFVDDWRGTGRPPTQRADMITRGWQSFVPLLRVWDAVYEPGQAGAAQAARLAVSELRHRGVGTPSALRVAEAVMGDQGPLELPGLGISSS
ncbi:hypothetical protein [Streptomyces californicus]|uniref:hypothetical protein n=1 Tax=Streptomyces californicus TaxID=67351 RepID=UPI00296ECEC2|nr:hypothetical protein [Streptomyces californicus]MDW4918770.1 hypothetical protein [Streptomyces californicus]